MHALQSVGLRQDEAGQLPVWEAKGGAEPIDAYFQRLDANRRLVVEAALHANLTILEPVIASATKAAMALAISNKLADLER